jgi:SAM-dependent methyltransferase
MVEQDREADANRLSAAALNAGDPTGWFEQLYAEAAGGQAIVPWDRREPHPLLVEWAAHRPVPHTAHRTLVVGSGLGDDAAYLSGLGWGVIAFDISPTAIAAARHRFPATPADFRVADVLDPPQEWTGHFDLVLESYTTQALPVRLRPTVIKHVARFLAPGGTLLVLAAAREEGDSGAGPPWPLSRSEIESYSAEGLTAVAIDEVGPPDDAHWRAEFTRGRK